VNVNPDKDPPPAFEIIHRGLIGFLDDSALRRENEETAIGNPYHRGILLRYRERVNYHRLPRI